MKHIIKYRIINNGKTAHINIHMFNTVSKFESQIADFYNAPYAVAVDCCTHAIELCLRYTAPRHVSCPAQTYISIPFTFDKLGLDWEFTNEDWIDSYTIGGTNIVDAAVHWQQGIYQPGTFMCLSFQFKKHLSLGRGGMILCETQREYSDLKKMSYDGRLPNTPWAEQDIDSIGYHYYMTPETAQLGIDQLPSAISTPAKVWSCNDYPFLPHFTVFRDV